MALLLVAVGLGGVAVGLVVGYLFLLHIFRKGFRW